VHCNGQKRSNPVVPSSLLEVVEGELVRVFTG
jgi:hypothetical protein